MNPFYFLVMSVLPRSNGRPVITFFAMDEKAITNVHFAKRIFAHDFFFNCRDGDIFFNLHFVTTCLQ